MNSKSLIQHCTYDMQPRNKNQQITVVTFGRAGEDNKSFKLTDIDTTIAGFAGADYDMYEFILLLFSASDDPYTYCIKNMCTNISQHSSGKML